LAQAILARELLGLTASNLLLLVQIMGRVTVIILHAFVYLAHAGELAPNYPSDSNDFMDKLTDNLVENVVDKLVNNLFDRPMKTSPLRVGTRGIAPSPRLPSLAVIPSGKSQEARALLPLQAKTYSTPDGFPLPLASYRPLSGQGTQGYSMLAKRGKGIPAEGFGSEAAPEAAESDDKEEAKEVPEEVFYDGPPAISETYIPTFFVWTIVGLIPALAAWSRQVWVNFKITNKGITIKSGFGGNEEQTVPLSGVTKFRAAKRLFGDGDLVLGLGRQQLEMRNVPNIDNTITFILKNLDPEVKKNWEEFKKAGTAK